MRCVLALRAACAKADIKLQLDLGGGEALVSRGRAGMMAKFLASAATHLLFVDGDQAFDAVAVTACLQGGGRLAWLGDGQLLIGREAAERISKAEITPQARLSDVRGAEGPLVPMAFEATIGEASRGYEPDLFALIARWVALEGPAPAEYLGLDRGEA